MWRRGRWRRFSNERNPERHGGGHGRRLRHRPCDGRHAGGWRSGGGGGGSRRGGRARDGRARHQEWSARSRSRSEEHTSELQSHSDLVCRLLLEKKKKQKNKPQVRSSTTSPPTHASAV